MLDRFGQGQWVWPDYPDGEPLYSPQAYNIEQLETLRTGYIKREIEALYPQDVQLKVMMEQTENPEAYKALQIERRRIKCESKKIDFNRREDENEK